VKPLKATERRNGTTVNGCPWVRSLTRQGYLWDLLSEWLHRRDCGYTDFTLAYCPCDCLVASVSTTWRLDARIDADHLAAIKGSIVRCSGQGVDDGGIPAVRDDLSVDMDAVVTIDQSEGKENSAGTWEHTYGFHPFLAFLDRPEISAGERWPG